MNNIIIGQYIKGDSWLHKLDPRNKIVLTILWIVTIFLIPNIYGMLVMLGLYLIMFFTTGLPISKVIKGLRPILFLLIFTFVLQVIYTKEGNLLYTFHFQIGLYQFLMIIGIVLIYLGTRKIVPIKLLYFLILVVGIFLLQLIHVDSFVWANYDFLIYEGGLIQGSFVFLRIILMIGITTLLTLSTMSTDINNGLESLLSPLKKIKIPVGEFAMIISLTLRFIPMLYQETNKIMKAQASRGVDFTEGSLKSKINQIISLLIPMFVMSFNKAEDLANAMETRGYVVGAKRSRLDVLKLKVKDYISFSISIIIFGLVIWWKVVY